MKLESVQLHAARWVDVAILTDILLNGPLIPYAYFVLCILYNHTCMVIPYVYGTTYEYTKYSW